MSEPRFRVWFGDTAASTEALQRIERIEVVQEMDAIWEARIEMALCLDEKGVWLHWPGATSAPFSRIRVEIDIGDGRFVPLIDGPLVSIDGALDAAPGRSVASMIVRDDSAFLDRDEDVEPPFEHRSDSDIAEEFFRRFAQIRDTRVERTQATPQTTVRRGTVLQFLRTLASRNDRHAYVLPGATPGASIGCFLADPAGHEDLPPLRLLGADRNLADARIVENPHGAERTAARVLSLDDRGVVTFETSAADLGLMRDLPARPVDLTPRRLLPPADNLRADPSAAASGRARRAGYVYTLTSELTPGCYGAVLAPYRKLRVDAGATPYSGAYLLTRVTHRITPSVYSQHIEAKTDSLTRVSGAQVAEAAGGALQLSVSASVEVF